MKKVYSNRVSIYLSIFGIVIFSIAAIMCVCLLVNYIPNNQTNIIIASSVMLVVFICFIFPYLVMLNRYGCKIIYNEEEQIIIRKGFVCGYEYRLKVEDIKDIIIATIPWDATYYIMIDSVNTKYVSGSKESFLRIEKNDKNKIFIKQFWNKPIKEYKENEYADLIK